MKAKGFERVPIAAAVVTAIFAIQVAAQSGTVQTRATSTLFWGEAIAIAPLMRATEMADASALVRFVAMIAVLLIVFAFLETAVVIALRGTSPRVRWLVRVVAGILVIGLLLFTPPAAPMRLF